MGGSFPCLASLRSRFRQSVEWRAMGWTSTCASYWPGRRSVHTDPQTPIPGVLESLSFRTDMREKGRIHGVSLVWSALPIKKEGCQTVAYLIDIQSGMRSRLVNGKIPFPGVAFQVIPYIDSVPRLSIPGPINRYTSYRQSLYSCLSSSLWEVGNTRHQAGLAIVSLY